MENSNRSEIKHPAVMLQSIFVLAKKIRYISSQVRRRGQLLVPKFEFLCESLYSVACYILAIKFKMNKKLFFKFFIGIVFSQSKK